MDYDRIIGLLDKYWKCETTLPEEEELRYFYKHCRQMPEELAEYRELFIFQEGERQIGLGNDFDRKILASIYNKRPAGWRKGLRAAAVLLLLYKELLQFAGSIKNTYISSLLKAFFVDDADFIRKFKSVAAGKSVHHGFAGGLLEHSLSVTRMCDKIASNYDFLNRDLLVACGMLHDCGKVRELAEFPKNDYTDEGNFLGHIVMGYEMVTQKMNQIEGFPETLKAEIGHCILAHHRELEYGSPKKPAIAEALALAFADDCDAKMETMREALEAKDTNDWLGYNRWIDANIKRTIV